MSTPMKKQSILFLLVYLKLHPRLDTRDDAPPLLRNVDVPNVLGYAPAGNWIRPSAHTGGGRRALISAITGFQLSSTFEKFAIIKASFFGMDSLWLSLVSCS